MKISKHIFITTFISILFVGCSSINDYKPLYEAKPIKEDVNK